MRAKEDRRAAWTCNRSAKLAQEELKARFALHFLKCDVSDKDYVVGIKYGTQLVEEKLFGNL